MDGVQQELKRMREICQSTIIISDISNSSKNSKKDKKAVDQRNLKNTKIFKDVLDLTKEKELKELSVPVKSQNWLTFQSKVKNHNLYS